MAVSEEEKKAESAISNTSARNKSPIGVSFKKGPKYSLLVSLLLYHFIEIAGYSKINVLFEARHFNVKVPTPFHRRLPC